MKRSRKLVTRAVVLAFTLLLLANRPGIPPSRLTGYGGCTPGRSSTLSEPSWVAWDAWLNPAFGQAPSNQEVTGIYSDIVTYQPYYDESDPSSFVTPWAWVMLTVDTAEPEWAQIGLSVSPYVADHGGGNSEAVLIQYNEEGWDYPITDVIPSQAPSPGTSEYYTTLYDYYTNGSGQPEFSFEYANSTEELNGTPITPLLNWAPNDGQLAGETQNQADQMEGDMVDPATFQSSNIYTKIEESGVWENVGWNAMNTAAAPAQNWNYYSIGAGYVTNPYTGYDNASATELETFDLGCPASATTAETKLTAGGTYPVLDASGTGSSNEIESNQTQNMHNGPFYFEAQSGTGNFFEYDTNGYVLWTPGIVTTDSTYSIMQTDCNYVIYDAFGMSPLFNTGTQNDGSTCDLKIDSSGNLDVYNPSSSVVWSNYAGWDSSYVDDDPDALMYGTSIGDGGAFIDPTDTYELYLEPTTAYDSGDLVLFDLADDNEAIWQSGDTYSGATVLCMQTDGNLVEYEGSSCTGTALWNTGTEGSGSYDHMLVNPQGTFSVQEVTQTGNQNAWAS